MTGGKIAGAGFRRSPYGTLPSVSPRRHPYFEAERTNLSMDSAVFGPLRVHYRCTGTGPPLLLVHGLMTSSYSWRYVLGGLRPHFRVIAVDLPGCGRSSGPTDRSYGISAIATWLGEFQRAMGIEGCLVVGNSLGGCFVLRRALDDPAAFARIAVVHPPVLPEMKHHVLHAALSIPGTSAALSAVIRRSPLRWAHRNIHYFDESIKSLEEMEEYSRPLAHRTGRRIFTRYLKNSLSPRELAANVRLLRLLDGCSPVPVLAVYGREADPLVPPRMGNELKALLPDVDLHWVAASSHFVQVDQPEAVVATLIEFFCHTE